MTERDKPLLCCRTVDASKNRPHRWAFFCYAHNYGDTSRAIEVAKAMRDSGAEVHFLHRGGAFAECIEQAGLPAVALEPQITEAQHRVLMDIDQHRAPVGTPLPYTEDQLGAMVESEIEVLRRLRPDGVYAGLNLSCMISVRYLELPMVTLVPTALCPAFFRRGLASFPDAMNVHPLVRYGVPAWLKRKLINRIMLGHVAKKTAATFNKVRARYGLPPIYNYTALVRGDLTVLPDLPELSGLPEAQLPDGYVYTGPLFAKLDLEVSDEVTKVFARPGVNVYCAMGSSGSPELLALVVGALRSIPEYNVVCATTTILEPEVLGPPSDNFHATRYLPAHRVNPMADVAVTHGGQGTIQTAVRSATPVVGVGFQWEQQANLDRLAEAGMATRIPLQDVTAQRVLNGVEAMLSTEARSAAQRMSELVQRSGGPQEVVRHMNELLSRLPAPSQKIAAW